MKDERNHAHRGKQESLGKIPKKFLGSRQVGTACRAVPEMEPWGGSQRWRAFCVAFAAQQITASRGTFRQMVRTGAARVREKKRSAKWKAGARFLPPTPPSPTLRSFPAAWGEGEIAFGRDLAEHRPTAVRGTFRQKAPAGAARGIGLPHVECKDYEPVPAGVGGR